MMEDEKTTTSPSTVSSSSTSSASSTQGTQQSLQASAASSPTTAAPVQQPKTDTFEKRELWGGAFECMLPSRFVDVRCELFIFKDVRALLDFHLLSSLLSQAVP